MQRLALLVALALGIAGCDSSAITDTAGPAPTRVSSTTIATTSVTPTTTTSPPVVTTAEVATTLTTAARTAVPGEVILGGDGLGVVLFGDSADGALAELEAKLGPPVIVLDNADEIVAADNPFFTAGPDMTAMLALWPEYGLSVAFSDWPFYREDGLLHMSGWGVMSAPGDEATLRTEYGVGVGSTFDEVMAAFGDRTIVSDDECGPPVYLRPQGSDDRSLRLGLGFDGELPVLGASSVVYLRAGASPGC